MLKSILDGVFPEENSWILRNLVFSAKVGSLSYGTHSENSDIDIIGLTIPTKTILYPHLQEDYLYGFNEPKRWEGVEDTQYIAKDGIKYDYKIYNIVKFTRLCQEGSPNVVESLFANPTFDPVVTPLFNVRNLFLTEYFIEKLTGFAKSQTVQYERLEDKTQKKAYKFLYHATRLLLQVHQIYETGDLKLDLNGEFLKEIKDGKEEGDYILIYISMLEYKISKVKAKKTLPREVDKKKVLGVLRGILEEFYQPKNLESFEQYKSKKCAIHGCHCQDWKKSIGKWTENDQYILDMGMGLSPGAIDQQKYKTDGLTPIPNCFQDEGRWIKQTV